MLPNRPSAFFLLTATFSLIFGIYPILFLPTSGYETWAEAEIVNMLNSAPRGTLDPQKTEAPRIQRHKLCLGKDKTCPYCYTFSIRVFLTEFKFHNISRENSTQKMQLGPSKLIQNQCSDNLLNFLSFSRNLTHRFTWTFREPLDMVSYLVMKNGIPLTVEDDLLLEDNSPENLERVVTYGPGRNQTVVYKMDVLVNDTTHVIVPPLENLRIGVVASERILSIPFTALARFSSLPQRACRDKCQKSPEKPSCVDVQSNSFLVDRFLRENKFEGKFSHVTPDDVQAEVQGVFHARYFDRVEVEPVEI